MNEETLANSQGWLFYAMDVCATAIGALGVVIIVWGVLLATVNLVRVEAASFRGRHVGELREELRSHLGYYLLLGLEFLVAADIIKTLQTPTLEHLAILGGIVIIRTVISVSLDWELGKADKKS